VPLAKGIIGNPVEIRDGPAAVIGDELCNDPLIILIGKEQIIRMIRKSEDLPGSSNNIFSRGQGNDTYLW